MFGNENIIYIRMDVHEITYTCTVTCTVISTADHLGLWYSFQK